MVRKKKRVFQHIMEDKSYAAIKNALPEEWVIREFNRPDYGIDLVIELFEKTGEDDFETLGEFIYVQVKSVQQVEIIKKKVYPVGNVAKGPWVEDKSEYAEIEVITFNLDTNSIFTIQSMGGSVAVLLFVVDLTSDNVYFVCLNDYIDKIILPKYSDYGNQDTISLAIPVYNNLRNLAIMLSALGFYGKRGKLLAAFSTFAYQKNEIAHLAGLKLLPVITFREEVEKDVIYAVEGVKVQILYFMHQIEGLDIWDHEAWVPLPQARKDLMALKTLLLDTEADWQAVSQQTVVLWHQLGNLGNMYEEICREWYLPKMMGILSSYPTIPEVVKVVI